MKPLPLIAAPLVLALFASLGTAAPTAAQPEEIFGGVAEVTVVEVPVQVVHQGEPLAGLTARDFQVLDEGTPRAITSFEVIDLSATTTPAGTAPPTAVAPATTQVTGAGRRHFLLLFDLAFTPPHDLEKAERAARELLDGGGLHPSDLVGVAFYSPRRGASLLVNFTTDRGEVRRVLDGLRTLLDGGGRFATDAGGGAPRRDPLGLTAGPFDAVLADVGAAAGIELSLAEEAMRNGWAGPSGGLSGGLEYNKISNMMWSAEQQIHDRRAGRVSDLARALASLARQTLGIRGAKHLVLFSSGFDADLLQPKTEAGPRLGSHAWWATGGGTWVLDEVKEMIGELRRAGWLVHAVELGGLEAHGRFGEGLFFVARETGGALYENTNDVGKALGQVLAVTSVTYLLTFAVEALPAEPAFRRLEVRVDGLPRGARVNHRAGYPTPRSFHSLSSAERRADTLDLLFSGGDRDPIGSRLRAVPFRRPEGGTGIAVVLDLDGAGLAAGPEDRPAGAEIYGYAFDSEGRVVDFFAHRVAVSDETARDLLTSGGLRFLGDFDVADGGRYRVRVVTRSLRDGTASVRTLDVELRGSGTVHVSETPTRMARTDDDAWLVVREVAGRP